MPTVSLRDRSGCSGEKWPAARRLSMRIEVAVRRRSPRPGRRQLDDLEHVASACSTTPRPRSASCSASSMSWVTNTTVLPVASQVRSTSARMRPRMFGSSAENRLVHQDDPWDQTRRKARGRSRPALGTARRPASTGLCVRLVAEAHQPQKLGRLRPPRFACRRGRSAAPCRAACVVARRAPGHQPRRLELRRRSPARASLGARPSTVTRPAVTCEQAADLMRSDVDLPRSRTAPECRRTRRGGRRSSAGRWICSPPKLTPTLSKPR